MHEKCFIALSCIHVYMYTSLHVHVSKCGQKSTLFNKHKRQFIKRPLHKQRRKVDLADLTKQLVTLLKSCFHLSSLVLGLPKKCMVTLSTIMNNRVAVNNVSAHIVVLVKDSGREGRK